MASASRPKVSNESSTRDYVQDTSKLAYIPYQRKRTPIRGSAPNTLPTLSNLSPTRPQASSGPALHGIRSSSAQTTRQDISPLVAIASSPTKSDSSGTGSPIKVNERAIRSPRLPSAGSPPPLRRVISQPDSSSSLEVKEMEKHRRTFASPSGSPLKQQMTVESLRAPSPNQTHEHLYSYTSLETPQEPLLDRSSPTSTSTVSHASMARRTPYRSGFQPKGVVRHRTDEFVALRAKKRGLVELDDQRMERRLEKLLKIYSPDFDQETTAPETSSTSGPLLRHGSFVWDIFYSKQEIEKQRLQQARRLAEQNVVKWQDDKSFPNCTICGTPFSLAVRRHHCRLCGHVVCSSPHLPPFLQVPNDPKRLESWAPCSALMIPSSSHKRLRNMPPRPGPHATLAEQKSYETAELYAIRLCRTCKNTIDRIQFGMNGIEATPLDTLYQGDISEALPDYHEMLLGLKNIDMTSKASPRDKRALQADTMLARKELLARFTQYDQLAKQIMALPPLVDDLPCATQRRLQEAILARANLFLRKHTFPFEQLPSLTDKPQQQGAQERPEVQEQLRVLREQDMLLDQYLAAAKKARNLDDVSSLKRNQEEIRLEIERIQRSAHCDDPKP